MARAFLDYTKTILKKVSFDTNLFQKELYKAVDRLLPFEIHELYMWMQDYFRNEPQLQPCIRKIKKFDFKP